MLFPIYFFDFYMFTGIHLINPNNQYVLMYLCQSAMFARLSTVNNGTPSPAQIALVAPSFPFNPSTPSLAPVVFTRLIKVWIQTFTNSAVVCGHVIPTAVSSIPLAFFSVVDVVTFTISNPLYPAYTALS